MAQAKTALSALTITPYQRRYLQAVRDLIFHSHLVHTHLDWHETDHWLDTQNPPARLAWLHGRLVGALAASIPLNHTAWVRLAAVHDQTNQGAVLYSLWDSLRADLKSREVRTVALLAVRDWILDYTAGMGFRYVEDVVTLVRYGHQLPDARPHRLILRAAEPRDVESMTRIDNTAFPAPWQLSFDELRQAHRIAASCSVALLDGKMVGYQLSTLYFDGAHLARLGVLPELQGTGIGGILLRDTLERFFRRGVYSMTLNTQASNLQSQRLYRRFGFRPNGYDLPFWTTSI